MGYFYYTLTFILLILGTVLYLTRQRWIPFLTSLNVRSLRVPFASNLSLPQSLTSPIYSRLPQSFMGDVESGLTSSDFDLSGNVMEGDSRGGLDQKGKEAVQRIMKRRGVGFDEARRIYMQERFRSQGIGEDGVPRDPKFVSFS